MISDQGIRDIGAVVREKIAASHLPTSRPDKVFVGRPSGKPCDACDLPIIKPEGRTLRFHQKCFDVWHEQGVRFLKPNV
jgi:hypothetical protein